MSERQQIEFYVDQFINNGPDPPVTFVQRLLENEKKGDNMNFLPEQIREFQRGE